MALETHVKLFRSLLSHRFMRDPVKLQFWIWCILKATHTKHVQLVGNEEVTLEVGQFITGREAASNELGMSQQSYRTVLKAFQKSSKISVFSTNKYSIITVTKFHTWQSVNQRANQQDNQQLTSNQPATNQQLTTNKKVKNEKKESLKGIGVFENVKLTEDELIKLKIQFGDSTKEQIDNLSIYIKSKGDKYKSHYATILSWERKNVKSNHQGITSQSSPQEILPASHVGKSLGLDRYSSI